MFGTGLGMLAAFQRSFMYFPDRDAPVAADWRADGVSVVRYPSTDGLMLSGWHWPAQGGRRTIVWFQGNGGHAGHRAGFVRPYIAAGYGVLLAGYRGYGGNPGSPSEEGLNADARGALDWLAGQGVPAGDVVTMGESLGTGLAVQMATERPVAAVVLFAPYLSMAELGRGFYPWLPVEWLLLDRFDSAAKIAAIRAPLLIVHGEQDGTVPVAHGRALLAAATVPKRGLFVPEAGHNDLYTADVAAAVLGFLAAGIPPDQLPAGTR